MSKGLVNFQLPYLPYSRLSMDLDLKDVFIGVIPGGMLIVGGCAVYLYTRLRYEPPTPEFKDFHLLQQHLLQCKNRRDNVIVEGIVTRLGDRSVRSEKAGIEGAARKVTTTKEGKTSTSSDISVPFLLVDANGRSIKITSVENALRISNVMDNVWDEPNDQRELMLKFDTTLGLVGPASLSQSDEVTLIPEEADKTLAISAANQRYRRRLLYAGSAVMILGGLATIVLIGTFSAQ